MCIRDRRGVTWADEVTDVVFHRGDIEAELVTPVIHAIPVQRALFCLLYTSDAADERSSVDLGGRRIIKKKTEYSTEK